MTETTSSRWEEYYSQESEMALQCTINALSNTGRIVWAIFGAEDQNELIARHFRESGASIAIDNETLGSEVCADGLSQEPEALKCLPIYHMLRNLEAYGRYGLPVARDHREPPKDINLRTKELHRFVEDVVVNRLDIPMAPDLVFGDDLRTSMDAASEFRTLMDAASGRAKLDEIHEDIELKLDEIAALAGMTVKSVRNATTAKGKDNLAVDENGGVDPEEAERWLRNRRGFRGSVWHVEDDAEQIEPANDNAHVDSVVFVPMAHDGSTFSPDDQKGSVYRVGMTAEPEIYQSFDDALHALQHMKVPRWHAPRKRGWTVYTADRWVRVPKEDMQTGE